MKKILLASLLLAFSQGALAEDLIQVYKIALDHDPVLREAAAKLKAQKEAKPLALSQVLPHVSAGASANAIRLDPSQGRVDRYGNRDFNINLQQTLFRRDQFIRLEQSEWQVEQAEARYRAQQQDLALRVARAYFAVLTAQETLNFVRADKKATARQLEQAKQRFHVGLIPITGVHEAQARYDQAVTNEIVANNTLDNAWEDLRQILGMRPKELADLKKEISLNPPMPADIGEWSAMALKNSPDVKAASDATQVAQREVEVQRSGHFPTVDLVGSYDVNHSNSIYAGFKDTRTASVGVQLNLPLYLGGGVQAATRQAQANLIAAQEKLDQARREVDKKVRNAYRQVQASISAVRSLKAATISTKSALDATKAGFDVGSRTMVDVLNAQRDYYRALRDHARARYNYVTAILALKRAAGVLDEKALKEINALLSEN